MNPHSEFSFRTRARSLESLARETFDVLVLGGGITGAGVARDAALRGLSVAVIEARDFASGTSSRSSKLIHGGIRYLQQGDVALVREAATERYALRKLAPHLAMPTRILVPVSSRRGYAKISAGLWAYERLAGVSKGERYQMLDKKETLEIEPLLEPNGVYGAGFYYEYLTDDARLVTAVLKSAASLGAVIVNHAEALGFVVEQDRICGVNVRDKFSGDEFTARGRVVVNATGPWVDGVRLMAEQGGKPRLRLTKGIHVGLRHERLPISCMAVMTARDRRSIFAIPRGEITYIGTTDTDYPTADSDPYVSLDDVSYLLDAANRTFAVEQLSPSDVVSVWAGLRPLLHQEGKKPSELSRKDEVMVSGNGLISVAGGKLTTFRRMAERLVDLVALQLGVQGRPETGRVGASDEALLSGGETGEDVAVYSESLAGRWPGQHRGVVERLVRTYGSNAERILETIAARPELGARFGDGAVTRAEVEYAVSHEMALTLEDFLERRGRLLLWDPDNGLPIVDEVATTMAAFLGWDERRLAREVAGYRAHVSFVKSFSQSIHPEEHEAEDRQAAHG